MKIKNLFLIFLLVSLARADEQFKFIHSNTFVKNPLDLRDPFKRKINRKKDAFKGKSQITGVYKNYDDNIENKPVETIKIVGVLIGPERRAMAKLGSSKETYLIKEGMRIGANQAEVKAILPGGVILVEKIRNVYDQDEYLETVLPVAGE